MKKILHKITSSKATIYILYLIVRIYSLTVSIKIENERTWLKRQKNGEPVLLCLSHQQFFYMVRFFRRYFFNFDTSIIISQSRDGDIAAWLAEFSGLPALRGSSSKGGKLAMEGMINFLNDKKGIGFNIVDGPRGPLGIIKPGSIRIAQKTGASIVPTFLISNDVWHVNSWDRFMIPKPFSTVTLKFGEMIQVDDIQTSDEFESARLRLEQAMAPYINKTTNKRE